MNENKGKKYMHLNRIMQNYTGNNVLNGILKRVITSVLYKDWQPCLRLIMFASKCPSLSCVVDSMFPFKFYAPHHSVTIDIIRSSIMSQESRVHSFSKESSPNKPDKRTLYGRKNRTRSAMRPWGRSSYSLFSCQPVEVPKDGKYVLTAALIRSDCCSEVCGWTSFMLSDTVD